MIDFIELHMVHDNPAHKPTTIMVRQLDIVLYGDRRPLAPDAAKGFVFIEGQYIDILESASVVSEMLIDSSELMNMFDYEDESEGEWFYDCDFDDNSEDELELDSEAFSECIKDCIPDPVDTSQNVFDYAGYAEWARQPVTNGEVSVRAESILHINGFNTWGEVAKLTNDMIIRLKSITLKTAIEIEDYVKAQKVKFNIPM